MHIEHEHQIHDVGGYRVARRSRGPWVDPAVWQREDMRCALAVRDISTVYRLLQQFGASQRQIAARVEQSQSEISEILGGRTVVSYDVLVRIASGLGVPRGWMGLAYDQATAELLAGAGVLR